MGHGLLDALIVQAYRLNDIYLCITVQSFSAYVVHNGSTDAVADGSALHCVSAPASVTPFETYSGLLSHVATAHVKKSHKPKPSIPSEYKLERPIDNPLLKNQQWPLVFYDAW
jgi:hypothetical protein